MNQKIRVPKVRCVQQDGTMVGVIATRDALRMAEEQKLDLVEVSPNADPPVCRIMDFGKYRYDESLKRKKAKKNSQGRQIKEIKFHVNVGEHDYETKLGHVREFIAKGHKVKLTLTFRGRENAHKELGFELMERVVKELSDVTAVEMTPRLLGRNINAMLAPKPGKG